MVHLNKPWPGDPEVTQWFGPTDFAGEPAGFFWPDRSITYFTVGGQRVDHAHCGIDYALISGTPLVAPADGVVEFAGQDTTGFGNCLKIRHDALGIGTLYGHLQDILVPLGATVKAGHVIARTNNTGNSSGPHLHFTVYRLSDRHYIDPKPFLAGPAPQPPQPPNHYHPVAFTVTADSDGHPINIFAGPSGDTGVIGQIAPGTKIAAIGYILGESKWDATAPNGGQWDARWILIPGKGWVNSARVTGNPPHSTPQ